MDVSGQLHAPAAFPFHNHMRIAV